MPQAAHRWQTRRHHGNTRSGGFRCTTGQLNGRESTREHWQDVNPAGGMEVANQIFIRPNIDRTLAAKAGIRHAQKSGGHVAPANPTHKQRGHECGNVLHHTTPDRHDAGGATQPGLLQGNEQRQGLLKSLGLFGGLDPDDRNTYGQGETIPEEGVHQQKIRAGSPLAQICERRKGHGVIREGAADLELGKRNRHQMD